MVEFNRNSIALLQKIKKLAKEEQNCTIRYDSPTLENDLRLLVKSGVSQELLGLVEDFLPTTEPSAEVESAGKTYRGASVMIDDRERIGPSTKVYRGRIVAG